MIKYFYREKFLLILNIIIIIIDASMGVGLAFVFRDFFNVAVTKSITEFKSTLLFSVGYILLCFLSGFVRRVGHSLFINRVVRYLKNDIFMGIISKDVKSYFEQNNANYISILLNDINVIEKDYFSNLLIILRSIVLSILASIFLVKINIYIALGVFVAMIMIATIPQVFNRKLGKYQKQLSDCMAVFSVEIKDIFSGFEVIKSFNIESKITDKFIGLSNEVEKKKFSLAILSSGVESMTFLFGFSMILVAISIGTYLTLIEVITIGSMAASIQLMNNVIEPIQILTNALSRLKSVKLINEKVKGIVEYKKSFDGHIVKTDFIDAIELRNVSFSYNGERNNLENISLRFEKGKKYAIVGESGSGKSTLIKLLLRYYDNFSGTIKMDGTDLCEIKSNDLYELISVIHQNVFMFDCSIKDNVTLFQDYSENEIKNALKLSGLEQLVNNLSEKEDTLIGENGCTLSGGQRQKIAIARAIIKNSSILILDEATSALDNETAYNIEKLLLEIDNITVIVVTHKLIGESLKQYDRIFSMKDGRIIEMGTFDELIDAKGYFYSLYCIQYFDSMSKAENPSNAF